MNARRLVAVGIALALVACQDDGDAASVTTLAPPPTPPATSVEASTTAPTVDPATPPAPLPAGLTDYVVVHNDIERRVRLVVPEQLGADARVPLIIVFHGAGGNPERTAAETGLDDLARSGRAVVAYPDALNATWNAGRCCGRAAAADVDDVGFALTLLEELSVSPPVDPARVVVGGHSNGAMLVYRLSCEESLPAAVLVAVSGTDTDACDRGVPAAFVAVHGREDQVVPFAGGETGASRRAGLPSFRPVDESVAGQALAAGCTDRVEQSFGPDVAVSLWTGCPAGAETALVVLERRGHPWPRFDELDASALVTALAEAPGDVLGRVLSTSSGEVQPLGATN